jgi:hypothetical protein
MKTRIMALLTALAVFSVILTSCAPPSAQPGVQPGVQRGGDVGAARDTGIDPDTYARFFANAKLLPDFGATDVRDAIDSFRVWFDPELAGRGLARAEIAAKSADEKRELVLTFEDEPVLFNDGGQGLDRERGDGIFTAALPLQLPKLVAEQAAAMRDLADVQRTLQEFPQFRGREVVTDEEQAKLIDILQSDDTLIRRFKLLRELGPELSRMAPAAILDQLAVEPKQTPILEAVRRGASFDLQFLGLPHLLFGAVQPTDVDPGRSLLITDVGVVEDPARTFDVCAPAGTGTPGGPWTFAYLMRQLALGSGMSAEDFTLQWLNTWTSPQEANDILVSDPGRGAQLAARVIDPWRAASGGTANIDLFPARLLAIVSRSDLANVAGYTQAGSAGEARFVFGLVENTPGGCSPLPFTVIFEYGIKANGCFGLKSWVQQWKDLDLNPPGSPAYNAALEAITHQFTDHGTNPGQLPNQSSLAQLRTNEIALAPMWELREFALQGPGSSMPGALDLVTVKQTPRFTLNNSSTLANYILSVAPDILAEKHAVPNRFPSVTAPFLDATALTPSNTFFWEAPGIIGQPNGVDLRHKLSLATCSGCHAGETGTFFTHIGTTGERALGAPAALSGFMTGETVIDPGDTTVVHTFNDLARRQQRVADVLNSSCFLLPFAFPTLKMVH